MRRLLLALAGLSLLLLAFWQWRSHSRTVASGQPAIVPMPARPTAFAWLAQLALLAGDGVGEVRDGTQAQARFSDPYGLVIEPSGSLLLAEGGEGNRIRRIGLDGQVTTVAGGVEGFRDGRGAAAAFNTPSGLAIDAAGNLYVADTGNHAIRKISRLGEVTTLAGNGRPGFADGAAASAQFNGPLAVAVGPQGQVYVADSYNDRIRVISPAGQVRTLAGGERPGWADGEGRLARFDTPSSLVLDGAGNLLVADTRNSAIRQISPAGMVSTLARTDPKDYDSLLRRPISLAISHDGFLYIGEATHGRIVQRAPDGRLAALAGSRGPLARVLRPTALALAHDGSLQVVDAPSYRVYRLHAEQAGSPAAPMGPSRANPLPATDQRWPVAPQRSWHEVVGTLGEVRGNYRGDALDHLHNGLDIRGDVGSKVLAIADGKVSNPLSTFAFNDLGEGLAIDQLSYIHMRVGRGADGKLFDPSRFALLLDESGKPERIRVRRGTRFKAGEPLGSINSMAHVHLSLGPFGAERNPLQLGFAGLSDHIAPTIEGIMLLDRAGKPLGAARGGVVEVDGRLDEVQIAVDAYDQMDGNQARRRLGVAQLAYQIRQASGPLPGFAEPRVAMDFQRLPADEETVSIVYAASSGDTVHGKDGTHMRYLLSNTVRDGVAEKGSWAIGQLPAGDYQVLVIARDFAGNEARSALQLRLRR